jgi:mercuric ion transport protein
MKKETVATGGALGGGALGTALVFATGCLGTKALVFLGISSGALSGLSALEPYRPLLLAVGAAALAVGLWRIVRRRKAAQPSVA